ncbi:MAG: glycosyltransferase family 4 protein [Candidatus Omnitrophica bacterium]|nr:glycosyltransferase family 4 protein [Candidatus Omnitrophota bacterium]
MNILYIHNKTQISGGETSLMNLWENMDRKAFNLFLAIPEKGKLSEYARSLNMKVVLLKIPKISLLHCFSIVRALISLISLIKTNKIDIIHSYSPRNNILGAIAGKLLGKPIIWHERNLPFGNEKDISRQLLFLPDMIICNSKAVAKRFETNNNIPVKVKTILNGVNVKRFSTNSNTDTFRHKFNLDRRKVVGIISNLNKRKNVDYFIDIAAKIAQKRKDVQFVIVGDTFEEQNNRFEELNKIISNLGLKDHFTFTKFVDDMPEILSCFNISVHVTEKEACSRAILESMACGKPVVALNDGGNPELIENEISGILVEPNNLDKFTETLNSLLDNDHLCSKLGEMARKRIIELFDINVNTKLTEDMYKSLYKDNK